MNEPREPEDAGRFEEEAGEEEHGFSPDVGRPSEEVSKAGDRAFGAPPEGKGPGREVTEEERRGVSSTETEPEGPLGVGVSSTRRAEEVAAEEEKGRRKEGVDERTGRPYGTSTAEEATGVEPQEPIDEESPRLPPGDQGG